MKLILFAILALQVLLLNSVVMGAYTHYVRMVVANDSPNELLINKPHVAWGKFIKFI